MSDYHRYSDELIELCHDEDYLKDEPYDVVAQSILDKFVELTPSLGGITASLILRWRLSRLFSGCEGADDLLVSLCMDLNGNPTSEMSHAMVNLASFDEVKEAQSSTEFLQKLQHNDNSFLVEFRSAYEDFLKRFGCHGMREIDVASPRTYED